MAGSERLNSINEFLNSNYSYEKAPSFETVSKWTDNENSKTISNKIKYNSNVKLEQTKEKIEKNIMNPLLNFLKNIGRIGVVILLIIGIFIAMKFLNEGKKFQKNYLKKSKLKH